MSESGKHYCTWLAEGEDREPIKQLFIETMEADEGYISSGEIKYGYSSDGLTWNDQFKSLLQDDVDGNSLDGEGYLVCRNNDGDAIGIAAVRFVEVDRIAHAYVDDIVVKEEFRNSGVGTAIMLHIEDECRKKNITWVMFESGLLNPNAHDFFKARGYNPVSVNFAKRID